MDERMEEAMSEKIPPRFQVRRLSEIPQNEQPKVLDEVVKVEEETWPEEIRAPKEKFESRAKIFPEGFLVISLPNLGMVGVSTAEIINYNSQNSPTSWEEITDHGWIKNTHRPEGNALYLVSVGASPKVAGLGVGTSLVKEQIELTKRLKLPFMILGSRLPSYADYHRKQPKVSVEDYLNLKRDDNLPVDPEIRFYTRCGLKPIKIVPNYMDDDPESENYGVVMIWKNSNQP